jgi:hypothetical protein
MISLHLALVMWEASRNILTLTRLLNTLCCHIGFGRWFAFAIIMSLVGLLFAIDHKEQRIMDQEAASVHVGISTAYPEASSRKTPGQFYQPTVF